VKPEKTFSFDFSNRKISYEEIEFQYQAAIDAATKQLFEGDYQKHGWTLEEFTEAAKIYFEAIETGKLTRWVN
jgi:hypothetical protein